MRRSIYIILTCLVITGCATTTGDKSMYDISAEELEKISQSENLTPEQKVIIKHGFINLKQASKTEVKVQELQKQIVKESKLAGAGKMTYVLIGFVCFLAVMFVGLKFLKKF